jgi:tetratricopeptide (TPR) repeat protein
VGRVGIVGGVGIVGSVGGVGIVRVLGFAIALVFVVGAIPAYAQIAWIQGKVTGENGEVVPGADVEVAIASLANVEFAVRRTDQTWRARANANGDYSITVPQAGTYLVTATREGVGTDRTKITVPGSGLVTANLTLWKVPAAVSPDASCGTTSRADPFKRNPLVTGAAPALVRLAGWIEAVQLHTPGCKDAAVIEVSGWAVRDVVVLLRDVRELVAFLHRAEDKRLENAGRGSGQSDQLIILLYNRRFTIDVLEREFFGGQRLQPNDLLHRAALLHADIAMFVPGDVGQYPLAEDGGRRGWRGGSSHWEAGRQLLDSVTPSASTDAESLLWYRAISAQLFRAGNLAELTTHLARAREVFPGSVDILMDSAYLHQELSSPSIQASVEQLRAVDVSVQVGSRRTELQRAERFLREVLAVAPGVADAYLRLGHTLGELGRHKEAAAALRAAIAAEPDRRQLYLSTLFLGREEEALGRLHEARRRYGEAVNMYPSAQSPQLALSRLARQTGDRASAQRSLQRLAGVSMAVDPWWTFYHPHHDDAGSLMYRMRQIAR